MRRIRFVQANQRWWRGCLMRGLAIVLGCLPIVCLELALRVMDWPRRPPPIDPYLDLHALKPLFEPADEEGVMAIAPERMVLFRPAEFKSPKPAGTFRIFALGGSTTQGEPYSTPTAFPEWLGIQLQAADPKLRYEVINCGGRSYASYRVLAILREVLQYEPDLILLYTGHNEYLERRSYAAFKRDNWLATFNGLVSELRVIQAIGNLGRDSRAYHSGDLERTNVYSGNAPKTDSSKTRLRTEVDALLDYRGGLADYQRGDAWMEPVDEHFRWNLEQMCSACQQAEVPLVLFKPVTNLLDCPPMKFEPAPSLDQAQREEFTKLWEEAREGLGDQAGHSAVISRLRAALEIDPEHAGAQFLLGRMLFESATMPEEYSEAKQHLIAARDHDVCPLRATSEIIDAVVRLAEYFSLPCVEVDELLASDRPQGIVGEQYLVDHVHPSVEGHQIVARGLFELLARTDRLPSKLFGWRERLREVLDSEAHRREWWEEVQQRYRQHLEGLNEVYFVRAKQRLRGLQLWTQGRSKMVREEPRGAASR